MTDWPILSTVTFLPLVGAFLVLMIRDDGESARRNIRNVTLWTTIVTFLLSLPIWYYFDNGQAGFQFVEKAPWLDSGISYHMGVDGISMLFVILTTFLMPLCILASWKAIQNRVKEYMIAFLVLETLMIGVFCALDIVLFYVFFEAVLVPMFIIIGVWGGGAVSRRHARRARGHGKRRSREGSRARRRLGINDREPVARRAIRRPAAQTVAGLHRRHRHHARARHRREHRGVLCRARGAVAVVAVSRCRPADRGGPLPQRPAGSR